VGKSDRTQISQSRSNPSTKTAMIMENGVSVPADFPHVDISVNDNPSEDYIFLNIYRDHHPFTIIFNNTGSPIWYIRTPDRDKRRDFKVQKNGVLSMIVRGGFGKGNDYWDPINWGHIALNENYNHIKTFHPVNGYTTDEHELQILENGTCFLIGRKDSTVDMSQYVEGGKTDATVRETVLQEFTPEGELVHQWRAWDHFDIRNLKSTEDPLTKNYIRFPHMNAIDIDHDGHILLSSRHLSEVTKIHRQTREIIWRLGGDSSYFEFKNDSLNGFSMQHDIRVLENGNYTVFDNGNYHSPQISRAVEYELDTLNWTATLVWEYRYSEIPNYFCPSVGNVQTLSNGNKFINWGYNKITEIRHDGSRAFDMSFVDGYYTYRAFRFPWSGMSLVPYLIIESHKEAVVLIFNKFGDPNVDYYKIYGGTSPDQMSEIDTSKATLKVLKNLENQQQYYFRVTAISGSSESDFSNLDSAFTNFINPGENMILNGDFSLVKTEWNYKKYNPARGNWLIRDETAYFDIKHGGHETWHIQLLQDGMELLSGVSYLFEFDAWADSQRTIEAKIVQNGLSYTNYSKIGPTLLTTQQTHYTYPFVMEDPSDFDALVVFYVGASDVNLHLDNVSFRRDIESNVEKEHLTKIPQQYELTGNYPNPFNAETTVDFSIPQKSQVRIELVNILGQFKRELCNRVYDAGNHQIKLNGNRLSSGIYFCLMEAREVNGTYSNRDVHKMMLIK
jgi:hypothetical protein